MRKNWTELNEELGLPSHLCLHGNESQESLSRLLQSCVEPMTSTGPVPAEMMDGSEKSCKYLHQDSSGLLLAT